MQLSKPKRGRQLVDFSHYDFGGGINIQDSPQELADGDLTQATNVYLSEDGGIEMRRGLTSASAAINGASVAPLSVGIVRFYQSIYNGTPVNNSSTVMQYGSSLYTVSGGTATMVGTAGQLGTNALPMQTVQVYDPQHGTGGSTILIICVGGGAGPFVWDGVALTTYTPQTGGTSVTGARYVAVVNDVVFFSGITAQLNLIVCSIAGFPTQTPGYNTFTTSSEVQGLGTLGVGLQTSLVAGLVSGLVLVSGFTPNSFYQQEIPTDDGVQAGLSMLTVDGMLYFIGNFAIYRYDGVEFLEISRKVRPWITCDPLYASPTDYPMAGNRSYAWAMEWNRRLYFWYPEGPSTSSTTISTALVYDLTRQGWTIYQSALPIGAGCLFNTPNDPSPEPFVVVNQFTGQTYNFDVFQSATNTSQVIDNASNVPSFWQSKVFKIGDPGTEKRLLRVYPELFEYMFNGVLTIVTDYGTLLQFSIIPINEQGQSGGVWDQSTWDDSTWDSGGVLNYAKARIDLNLQAEAYSFGISTPNPGNAMAALPGTYYKFMGFSGRMSQVPKN
jgi:hypothetical protein